MMDVSALLMTSVSHYFAQTDCVKVMNTTTIGTPGGGSGLPSSSSSCFSALSQLFACKREGDRDKWRIWLRLNRMLSWCQELNQLLINIVVILMLVILIRILMEIPTEVMLMHLKLVRDLTKIITSIEILFKSIIS